MAGNTSLGRAKEAKQDEYYTQLSDIEAELQYFRNHFKGKVVLCNCDDPYESNFFKYFILNFNYLGLKKLITTCYSTSPVAGTQISLFDEPTPNNSAHPYKAIIDHVEDLTGNGAIDLDDIQILLKTPGIVQTLEGDGDFRSEECIELLKEADIVVTNPPFSLFRNYVAQLIEYNKSFLIIGPMNALHYKEIFPLIKENKMWLGFTHPKIFIKPNGDNQSFGNINWYTNLDHNKRHEELDLYKRYKKHESEFPHYDNYDAIDVSKVSEIPYDYDGIMGVPDTFLEKYNPEQFEIIGIGSGELAKSIGVTKNYRGRTDIAYTIDGVSKCPYSRILIRRKE